MDWQKLKFAGEQIVHSVFQIQMSMKSVFKTWSDYVYEVESCSNKKFQRSLTLVRADVL